MPERAMNPRRRDLMALAACAVLPGGLPMAAPAEPPTGWVLPRLPAPAVRVTAAEGRTSPLSSLVTGKVTAVQLVFTGCSATCPAQGALFAALAGRLQAPELQCLSVSIDALGDTPAAMTAWQAKFGRFSGWRTSVADITDVDRLSAFMKGMPVKPGTHTAQVFIFDRLGRLSYRTGDSPGVSELASLMSHLAGPVRA